ncbi:hypothetical protein MOQ_005533 [Trypanosoma cruzi marinkellei]|uniref:Uncharacterized protein n=1 Tax=Trypanosoma cruzi marinkellei TaxID=85056 RepID=K2NP78_TRYCR|nr:hypothetical protein MOQ_005533 [Trypanosoma cruzi marinkellei]
MVEKGNVCVNDNSNMQLESGENPTPINQLEYRNGHTLVESSPLQGDLAQEYKELEKREAAGMENGRMLDFHDKWLHRFSDKPLTSRSQTRSQSYRQPSHDAQTASVCAPTDMASSMRYRCLINSARSAARRSALSNSYTKSTESLKLAERMAIQNILEREERRLIVLQRASEEYDRRGKLLIDYELQKESASLHRITELERKKIETTRERQYKLHNRMELAKMRREMMERERQEKLEESRRRLEERVGYIDPCTMQIGRRINNGVNTPPLSQRKQQKSIR